MSANLDLVRSIYAAWERRDYSSAESAHPEIEFVFADGPTLGSWTGSRLRQRPGAISLGVWKDWRVEVEEFRQLDDERVLVVTRHSGRGRWSGLELGRVEAKGAGLYFVREGHVVKNVFYFERERAFTDLGIKE